MTESKDRPNQARCNGLQISFLGGWAAGCKSGSPFPQQHLFPHQNHTTRQRIAASLEHIYYPGFTDSHIFSEALIMKSLGGWGLKVNGPHLTSLLLFSSKRLFFFLSTLMRGVNESAKKSLPSDENRCPSLVKSADNDCSMGFYSPAFRFMLLSKVVAPDNQAIKQDTFSPKIASITTILPAKTLRCTTSRVHYHSSHRPARLPAKVAE